jgi:hypothetical protein
MVRSAGAPGRRVRGTAQPDDSHPKASGGSLTVDPRPTEPSVLLLPTPTPTAARRRRRPTRCAVAVVGVAVAGLAGLVLVAGPAALLA